MRPLAFCESDELRGDVARLDAGKPCYLLVPRIVVLMAGGALQRFRPRLAAARLGLIQGERAANRLARGEVVSDVAHVALGELRDIRLHRRIRTALFLVGLDLVEEVFARLALEGGYVGGRIVGPVADTTELSLLLP